MNLIIPLDYTSVKNDSLKCSKTFFTGAKKNESRYEFSPDIILLECIYRIRISQFVFII